MKKLSVIIIFFLFGCSTATKNKSKNYDNSSQINISKEMCFDKSVIQYTTIKDTISSTNVFRCPISYIRNDTIIILIGDASKTSLNLYIKYSNNNYRAFAQFYSDYAQYDGKYTIEFEAVCKDFTLSKSQYEYGDTIIGRIETNIIDVSNKYFSAIDSVYFKGSFVAIIND